MKYISRSLVLVLALVMMLSCVFWAAPKANAEVIVVDKEQTISLTLEYADACAVEGEILFSNSAIISNVKYDTSGSNMEGLVENGIIFLYTDNPEGVSGKIVITATIRASAAAGSSCLVTFRYATTAPGATKPGDLQTVIHSITVKGEPEPEPTQPDKDDKPVKYADTSKLKEQIAIAENLTYYEYTSDSWAGVEAAVAAGKELLTSTSQSKVDKATEAIKTALAALVPMDYTALQNALDSASQIQNMDEMAAPWERFIRALANARTQRTSGDQAAVDAATEELLASKQALLEALAELGEVVVVEKEVPVEVEPSYTFCNDPAHTIYLIIMIISLALNLILIFLIVFYLIKKNRKKKDKTPLVDYDIDDDMPDISDDMLE